MKRRILSMILAVFMVVGLMPTTAFAVSEKSDLGTNANTTTAAEIAFGTDSSGNPRLWRVIGYNGTGVVSESGSITLLAKDIGANVQFDSTGPYTNNYSGSNLQNAIKSSVTFTTAEEGAIVPVTLIGGTNATAQDGMYGEDVTVAKLWPLSVTEANAVNVALEKVNWWLRSPGGETDYAAFVGKNGGAVLYGLRVDFNLGVLPALKLNLNSVFFASAAVAGKPGDPSPNLTAVAAPSGPQKLTILDNSLSLAVGDKTSITKGKGESFTIAYSGATVGSNNYVSCLIEQNGAIKYYGKLAAVSANNGTATINLPADIPSGNYKIKLFCENINADNKTDYASAPVEIPLVVPPAFAVTYNPGDGGTGSQQTATKTGGTALTLKSAIFTRVGYDQTGWATANNGTKAYDLGGSFTTDAAENFFPVWTLKEATAPTLTGTNPPPVTFGYTNAPSMTVGISDKDDTNFNYSYAWYAGATAAGTAIAGASSDTYAPTGLAAGTHNYTVRVTATNKADGNETASADKTFTVTVNKTSGSGSVSMTGWTYGGTASSPDPTSTTNGTASVTYQYKGRGSTTYAETATKPTNAGDYTVTATFVAHGNFTECTATANFTIAKAMLTPSVASVTSKEYDGVTTASGTISLSGAVNSELPTATGTFAWTSENAGTTTVDVTGIALTNSWGSNYTLSTTSLTGVTAPNGAKISPKALTIPAQIAVYNGTTTINVKDYSSGVGSEKIDLAYTPSAKTSGAYTFGAATNGFTLKLSNTNYSVGSAGDLTVSAKALTIPGKSVTYNGGNSFTQTVTGENSEPVTVTYTAHSKDAGNYTYDASGGNGKYSVTLSDSTNYSVASGGTLTVNPIPATLTWDYAEPFTYDKTEKSVTALVSNKIGADSFTLSYTGNRGTNKGNYTATVTALGNSNYTLTGASGVTQNWAIAAQTVAKPRADPTVFTYTGSEQTYTIVPNALYTVTNNKRTNAESQEVTVALNDKSNYTWADGKTEDLTYTFAIAKAPVTFVVSSNTYTYDGVIKAATVTQTADQTPSVAGKFSVSYQQSGSTVTPKDAGSYDVIVTINDTNFKHASTETADFKVGTLTINKKPIMALWQNLHHVYDGTAKAPTFSFTGIEADDKNQVTARLSAESSKTTAGSYPVVAELTGTRSSNYTLTNPTGTLVIQKAPVIFTVSGDMVKHDGSPKTATVAATANSDTFTDFTVTYLEDKKVVATPSDVGTYDIYASVANDNYRHVDGTDGKARKIGVLNIYQTSAPASYTLSFSGGSGATGTMAALPATQPGTLRILPQNTFTKASSIFTGWMYNGKVYQPNESVIQGYSDITMTAQWADCVYAISGKVNQNNDPATDAVVCLMRGSEKLAETVTDANGVYHFATVVPGMYNLVASKNGVTQTVMVEIVSADASGKNISLPLGKTNSVVQVASGSPAIVVGNLEQTFGKIGAVYTAEDQADVAGGGSVEIKLTAKALTNDKSNTDQSKITAQASGTVALYLDFNLEKTVTKKGGNPETSKVPVSDVLLESVIQLPGELQGKSSYTVYRVHNTVLDALTTIPNKDGECIKVNSKGTALTVYYKNFSTYAIVYTTYSGGSGSGAISVSTYPISIYKENTGGAFR